MKAASLIGPGQIRLEEVEEPAAQAGQLRIRVEGCGVCGSNLPPWAGRPWFNYPFPPGSPGHEPWGTIESIGPDTTGFEVGQRVAFLTERGFAELAVADVSQVVLLPPALAGEYVPGEPLACAVNVIRRSHIQPGERIAVVGVGFLGALLIALARAAGAEVAAWSRRPFALSIAEQAGATAMHRLDEPDHTANQRPFDCVIEAAGEQRTLDISSALVRERGRLVIAGYHQDGARQIDLQSWNWRGLDVINAHERDVATYVSGMREGVDLVARGVIDPRRFYTHVFPLKEIASAFSTAAGRPEGFLKALVVA
jgi:NADPH2:quinone reductase